MIKSGLILGKILPKHRQEINCVLKLSLLLFPREQHQKERKKKEMLEVRLFPQQLQAIIERECSLFQIEHEEVKRERWSVKLGY